MFGIRLNTLLYTIATALILFEAPLPCSANSEFPIAGAFDGQNPYLVVLDDSEGGSKRSPGIYAADNQGKWQAILSGKVLTGGVSQGLLAQLSLSQIDRRYQALAVVDGKLRLFHIGSNSSDPNSTIIFGSDEHPLYDVNGQPVELPEIQKIEDIVVQPIPHTLEHQLVLISVKLPTAQIIGDGITFAILLKKSSTPGNNSLEIEHAPVVVDYKFQTHAQLNALVHPLSANAGVISRITLRSFLHLYRKQSSDALKRWSAQIKDALVLLEKSSKANPRLNNLPYFDLSLGRAKLVAQPYELHNVGGIQLVQVYDPISNRDGLVLGSHNFTGVNTSPADYSINGRIDKISVDGTFADGAPSSDNKTAIISLNREFYFLARQPDHTILWIKLDIDPNTPITDVAFQSVQLATKKDSNFEYYAFISTKDEYGPKTLAYVIKKVGDALQGFRRLTVYDGFIPKEELRLRIRIHQKADETKEILFDNLTPLQTNAKSYSQINLATKPFLNIADTLEQGEQTQTYLMPLEEKSIGSNFAYYKKFDLEGAVKNQTGIFIYTRDHKRLQTIEAELLQRPRQTESELTAREIKLYNERVSTKISVVALDAGFEGGKNSFQLATLITYAGDSKSDYYFNPQVSKLNIPHPFSQLSSVQLFQGNKSNKEWVYLICTFDSTPSQDKTAPQHSYVIIRAVKLDFDDKSKAEKLSISQTKDLSYVEKAIKPQEILTRIRFDSEGKMFWIHTPELDQSDSGFMVTNITTGQKSYLNSSASKATKLLTEDQTRKAVQTANEETDSHGFGSTYSSWEAYSKYSIENRVIKVKEDEATKSQVEGLFPGFVESLDSLVSSNDKPEHIVYVVADELKQLLLTQLAMHWGDEKSGKKSGWRIENKDVTFYIFETNKGTQKEVLKNLETMRSTKPHQRIVLFADAANLMAIGRPKIDHESAGFTLTDPTLPAAEQSQIVPHMMYLLATEGQALDFDQFQAREKHSYKIPMVIVASSSEWQHLSEHMGPEQKFNILKRFKKNSNFLSSTWKTWAPNTRFAAKDILQSKDQPISDLEKDVFPTLSTTLEELTDLTKPARHKILIVPEELKPLIKKLLLARWSSDRGSAEPWNFRNPALELYRFTIDNQGQAAAMHNLEVMRELGNDKRPVLIADLSEVRKAGRIPNPGNQHIFMIEDKAQAQSGLVESMGSGHTEIPHALYLLESEGRNIQPKELVSENSNHQNRISMLMIGTAAEWDGILKDLSLETRFDIPKRIEKVEMKTPSAEVRRSLLSRVTSSPEIQSLGYRFDATEIAINAQALTPEAARDKVLGYLTNRAETLANQFHQESTSAFIRVLTEFMRALVEDSALRNNKVIDRSYIERLLSKTFSIPLNLKILAPNDPLVRLSRDDAPLLLQEAGYEGPLELKAQVVRALVAQTRNDPVRPIPSSVILFGETSSGKTYLFKVLCKVQGLKMYDFNNPNDETAGAIIINVGKLTAKPNPDSPESMSVDEALKHLNHFMSLPNGYRGNILIDDAHKGDEEVVARIMNYLQSLFESNNGITKVKNLKDELREIPVRNLTVFMTLNPTQDQNKLNRFRQKGDDSEVVIATLSGERFQLERSFLQRWSLILNLSKFPIEAKAPKLQESLRAGARNDFNVQGRLVLIAPNAVTNLVNKFPDSNAREFLSVASSQLLQAPTDSSDRGLLYIVVPTSDLKGSSAVTPHYRPHGTWEASGRSNVEIETFINESTVALPIDKRIDGQLQLLSVMVDIFRTNAYESLVSATTQNPKFAAGTRQARALLAPMLHGITSNMVLNNQIPLASLNLDPYDFDARTRIQQEEFRRIVDADQHKVRHLFPIKFADELESNSVLDELLDHAKRGGFEKSRLHVLTEFSERLSQNFVPYLESLMRVKSLSALPDSESWLKALREEDSAAATKKIGSQISELFLEMWEQMYEHRLVENMSPAEYREMTTYDTVRLFMVAIDRAITRLPWSSAIQFMVKGLNRAAADMDMGQLPGVQHYLFTSKYSLLRPATHELILQMAMNSSAYKEWPEERKKKMELEFITKCTLLLRQR